MAYNGRPRKIVPEVGKDFPIVNGTSLTASASSIPSSSEQSINLADRDARVTNGPNGPSITQGPQQQQQQQSQVGQQGQYNQLSASINHAPPLQVPMLQQQPQEEAKNAESPPEPQQLTSIFRPDDDWKEQLARARAENSQQQQQQQSSGASAWDIGLKEEEDEGKEDESVLEDEEASPSGEKDGKIWKTRRTLRKSADS
jgi:striatin 1/3/4